ncbi:MAG: hypothetical protein ACE5HX_19270 [bacterium]
MRDLRLHILGRFSLFLFLVCSIFIFGCAHTHNIPQHSHVSKFNELNKKLANKKINLVLIDNAKQIETQNVHIASDSVYFLDVKSNVKMHLATSKVNKIIQINHGKGAVEGFGLGLLGGAAILGATTLVALNHGDNSEEDAYDRLGIVLTGITIGGGVVLISPFIGAARGSKNIYVLTKKNSFSKVD